MTFERGRPESATAELASEMCEVIGSTWGYAAEDISFKSMRDLLTSYMTCKRYGANFLLNVGPMGSGRLPDIAKGVLQAFGTWNKRNAAAVTGTCPAGIAEDCRFLLTDGKGKYYLFESDLAVAGNENVTMAEGHAERAVVSGLRGRVSRVRWLDNGEPLEFEQSGDRLTIRYTGFLCDENLLWRVAEITTNK